VGAHGLQNVTTADPSLINFSVLPSPFRHGFQAVLDPMADIQNLPGGHAKPDLSTMFKDMPPVPFEPYAVLTSTAISEELLHTPSVIVHEETHRAHSEAAIALFERWRSSGSLATFEEWVAQEVKARRLSPVEAALAIEQATPSSSASVNTETLSEVEGITSVYHAGEIGTLGLDRLPVMAGMWIHADGAVQDLAIRKLEHYYRQMMNKEHREAFSKKVFELLMDASNRGAAQQEFYAQLNAFGGT
jgi:hypothetical protein